MSQGISTQYADPQGYNRQLEDQFFGVNYGAVTLNTASGTTPQPVTLAATTLPYIYIKGVQITVDPTCTLAAGGILQVTLSASSTGTIVVLRFYVPATFTAPTVPTVIRQTSAPGNFFATQSPNETVSAVLNTALTAGSVRVSFNYGYSNVPIGN